VRLPHPRFWNGNSTKEEISIMKPKQIIISILAVLFVFPLMGTFAQQTASSGSIEVITTFQFATFDYPGSTFTSLNDFPGQYAARGAAHQVDDGALRK